MKYIIAVDPGGTTGVARYGFDLREFESFEWPCWDAVERLEPMIECRPDLVVCERFNINQGTLKKTRAGSYDALESIGAIRYLCLRENVPFKLYPPYQRKFATNARLAKLGWRNPSKGGHADDAARHLLVACVEYGVIDPEIFLEED